MNKGNVDITNMFDSIKESLENEKTQSSSGAYRNILKLSANEKPYLVRLVPNVEDPSATFMHYYHHGFTSNETGQYVDAISPSTWGDRCRLSEECFKLWKQVDNNGGKESPDGKPIANLARKLKRMEKRLVNVYVIDDPSKPENNGTIKILRMGIKLYAKVEEAMGEAAEEFGSRIFDLSENGCTFRIKVETTTGNDKKDRQFTSYDNSRFMGSSAIEGMTKEKNAEIYGNIYDLTDYVERPTAETLEGMINTHLYSNSGNAASETSIDDAVNDAVTAVKDSAEVDAPAPAKPAKKKKSTKSTVSSDKIDDLLKDIEGLED
jgi:hypothetical protein